MTAGCPKIRMDAFPLVASEEESSREFAIPPRVELVVGPRVGPDGRVEPHDGTPGSGEESAAPDGARDSGDRRRDREDEGARILRAGAIHRSEFTVRDGSRAD